MRKCRTDQGYTLLRFLRAGIADLNVKDGELEVEESGFLYGHTSSNVALLHDSVPQMLWRGAKKEHTRTLGEAMPFR